MRQSINSKELLNEYINSDKSCFSWKNIKWKDKVYYSITNNIQYNILKYLKLMRKEEYFSNVSKSKVGILKQMLNTRKKNRLGQKLQLDLYSVCFGKGLSVYHGNIFVNIACRFGENFQLHGLNCIGNNGKDDKNPIGGNNINLGVGACIIGNISLGNNIVIGANAIVNKSFENDDIRLVGIPANVK